jgi:dihydroorotase
MTRVLFCRDDARGDVVFEGVRVLDPAAGVDLVGTVRVEEGVITAVEETGGEARSGLVLAPAFVDPHVHIRTPGREDEETISTATAAAAAGGYCAILAPPNTDPVVDSASILSSLVERAREEASIPIGFMACISKGLRGEELTEMAELAAAGAAAFSDDGKPVSSAGLMQRALQYSAVAGRILTLHEEETSLSRDGQMHEGSVSAELGFAGWPSIAEAIMVQRDLLLARYESRPIHLMHLSVKESVDALRHARSLGVQATGEVCPHHLCRTDELVRSLDANAKMNPPLGAEDDRQVLLEGLRDGTITVIATDHAPHALHEKEAPFEEAPFGVTGLETAFSVIYTTLVEPGVLPLELVLERMSTGPAEVFSLPVPRIAVGETANLVLLDLHAEWTVTAEGFRSRSTNSWLLGETLRGRVVQTVADGRTVFAR